ncbi:glycosyltransferase family 2 protein [Paenibacillus tarimensis]
MPAKQQVKTPTIWIDAAGQAGSRASSEYPPAAGSDLHRHINELWCRYCLDNGPGIPDQLHVPASQAFLQAYCTGAGLPAIDAVLIPTRKTVTCIVTAMNEEQSIPDVLNQLYRLPLKEIIVVVNGSTDTTLEAVKQSGRAVVVHYAKPLGHDVGRAVGAKLADSDMLLFTDGDFSIEAEAYIPFINALENGADLALNELSPFQGNFINWDEVTMMKAFLNRSLGRRDLGTCSLTAVPHALSRKAVESIGVRQLSVPPKAQALALTKGLAVVPAGSVDVIQSNRIRRTNTGANNEVARLIVGDHLEALHTVLAEKDSRLSFPDQMRKRGLIRGNAG